MTRPNILLFLSDDHGQWASSCYGNSEVQTPHLDRLATEGVRFANAFTPGPGLLNDRTHTLSGLAAYLMRELAFPYGALLMTGTGIVPPDEFTLHRGDVVTITINGMTLENPVA